jgi:hypothetical protein
MATANTKKCSSCNEEHPLNCEFFHFRKNRGSWNSKCKKCVAEQKKAYNAKNRIQIKENKASYYQKNKEEIKSKRKEYYYQNKERVRLCNDNWKDKNKQKLIKYHKQYYIKNKTAIIKQNSIYVKNKRKTDLDFKLRGNVSRIINLALKKTDAKKDKSVFTALPYSPLDLKAHLESQFQPWMNWDNYGRYYKSKWDDSDKSTWTWQIDHVIPQSSLPYDSFEHPNFKKCWRLDNLRPLSSKENLLKSNRNGNF